jgi:hypothetical protein
MEYVLSVTALVISFGVLIVQYINQKERRHGEIVALKQNLIKQFEQLERGYSALLITEDLIRLEIRNLPDSEMKFSIIENQPRKIDQIADMKSEIGKTLKELREFHIESENKTRTLFALQEIAPKADELNQNLSDLNESSAKLLSAYLKATATEPDAVGNG